MSQGIDTAALDQVAHYEFWIAIRCLLGHYEEMERLKARRNRILADQRSDGRQNAPPRP